MKKVGILTFHRSHNCGSMLQTLALQNTLNERFGCEVEIIDFSNDEQKNMYAALPKADNYRRVIKNAIWRTNLKQLEKQYDSYEKFIKKYFKLSKESFNKKEQLSALKDKYDIIISGSDQVWNIACRDADDAYYLDFETNAIKNTYAVSFGANNPFVISDKKDFYIEKLREFKSISVREKNAQKWIKEATGVEVPICLDPTMLVDRETWENYVDIGEKPIIREKYIFFYCFSISREVTKFLKKVSKKYNMPVYFMDAKEWTLKMLWANDIRLIKEYGPDVYLNMVKYSTIFITTSFHGTAFSTIYNKNFWYIDNGHNDPTKDDRAISFLTQLDLMDRYKTMNELESLDMLDTPNYEETMKKLDVLKKESYKYIEQLVGN